MIYKSEFASIPPGFKIVDHDIFGPCYFRMEGNCMRYWITGERSTGEAMMRAGLEERAKTQDPIYRAWCWGNAKRWRKDGS